MPRVSPVDACLLCECVPCECNKPAKPRARKAAPKSKPESETAPKTDVGANSSVSARESMLARMRARAAQAPQTPVEPLKPIRAKPTAASAELKGLTPDDALEVAAIRALSTAFSVEGDAVDKWKPYLEKEPSRAERAAAWKMGKNRDEP